jgi:hypothetical protein
MEDKTISLRQRMVLIGVALLAPASELLPGFAAQRAGRGGWLAALCALPVVLIALWAVWGMRTVGGERRGLGRGTDTVLVVIYLAWTLLDLALALRLCAARLAVIYGQGAALACTGALLVVAVWMGLGQRAALARAGEVFYLALAVALGGVLLLSVGHVEGRNLDLSLTDAVALPGCGLAAAGLLLNLLPAAALGRGTVKAGDGRRAVKWVLAFAVAITLLLGAVIGCLGPKLTAGLPAPFLTMVQGLGVQGAFQRTEALVSALWALSDLILVSLLLHTWRGLAHRLHRGAWSRWSILPASAAAVAVGWTVFSDGETARTFCQTVLPVLGLALGLAVPVLARLLLYIRKR